MDEFTSHHSRVAEAALAVEGAPSERFERWYVNNSVKNVGMNNSKRERHREAQREERREMNRDASCSAAMRLADAAAALRRAGQYPECATLQAWPASYL
jgi:hypothetical protein